MRQTIIQSARHLTTFRSHLLCPSSNKKGNTKQFPTVRCQISTTQHGVTFLEDSKTHINRCEKHQISHKCDRCVREATLIFYCAACHVSAILDDHMHRRKHGCAWEAFIHPLTWSYAGKQSVIFRYLLKCGIR